MYRKSAQDSWKHLDFLLIDMVCLHLAFVLAYLCRHGWTNPYASRLYCNIMLAAAMLDIVVAFLFESFKNVLKRGYYKEFAMTAKHICLVELLLSLYLYMTQLGGFYSRAVYILQILFYLIVGYAGRIIWKQLLKKRSIVNKACSLLIVVLDANKEEVVGNICNENYQTYHVCGAVVLDRDMRGQKIGQIPVVASSENLADYICRQWVDEVLVALPYGQEMPDDLKAKIMEMGVVVHTMIERQDYGTDRKRSIERLGGYTVMTSSINQASAMQLFIKRFVDICVSLVGCFVTIIISLFIAPVIYLQSPGPIFFSQVRVGKNGKKFKIFKFRSMYPDAEERKAELMAQNQVQDGRMFKIKYDPRIIGCKVLPDGTVKKGIGNFLRDTSIDEFPQFFNVLKGDMSLVGTRPPTVDEWERYEYHHRARMSIKPGITGLWQVSGRSEITDFEEVVRLDLQYISEWSMGLDFRIMFRTVKVVLGRAGSM